MCLRPGAPAIENREDALVILSFAAPYAFLLCLYQLSYQRFVIPLLPYLACFAAWTIATLTQAARKSLRPNAAQWIGALALSLPLAAQAMFAVRLAQVRSAPDTIARAAAWFRDRQNFDRATQRIVVLPPLDLPLPQKAELLARNSKGLFSATVPWLHFQKQLAPEKRPLEQYEVLWMPMSKPEDRNRIAASPEKFVQTLDADFAVVHALEVVRFHPAFSLVRSALMSQMQLVARFTPDVRGQAHEIPLDYEDFEHNPPLPWAWRTLFAQSTGPIVEIYKLKRRVE
jgi:hypothetical protein